MFPPSRYPRERLTVRLKALFLVALSCAVAVAGAESSRGTCGLFTSLTLQRLNIIKRLIIPVCIGGGPR